MAKVMDAATANSLATEALSDMMEANYKQEEENLTDKWELQIISQEFLLRMLNFLILPRNNLDICIPVE